MNKVFCIIEFGVVYLWEVVKSNVVVAIDVLRPRHQFTPAMVKVDVSTLSDRQLFVYTNLVTMTPGTLSVEVSAERDRLLVHSMYAESPEEVARDLDQTLRRRITRVF